MSDRHPMESERAAGERSQLAMIPDGRDAARLDWIERVLSHGTMAIYRTGNGSIGVLDPEHGMAFRPTLREAIDAHLEGRAT